MDKDINLTYSGILTDKRGDRIVRVRFERGRSDYAEIVAPVGKITGSEGFTPEEVRELSSYVKEHKDEIFEKSKSISSFMHIFG